MAYLNLSLAGVMFATGNVLAGFIALIGWVVCMCFETVADEMEDDMEDLA